MSKPANLPLRHGDTIVISVGGEEQVGEVTGKKKHKIYLIAKKVLLIVSLKVVLCAPCLVVMMLREDSSST